MIRDRIVFGTNSHKIREKLIYEGKDLALDKATDIARIYELSQSQMKSMEEGEEVVHSVKRERTCKKEAPNPTSEVCSRRDQHLHEVSDNPYQINVSLFIESQRRLTKSIKRL